MSPLEFGLRNPEQDFQEQSEILKANGWELVDKPVSKVIVSKLPVIGLEFKVDQQSGSLFQRTDKAKSSFKHSLGSGKTTTFVTKYIFISRKNFRAGLNFYAGGTMIGACDFE